MLNWIVSFSLGTTGNLTVMNIQNLQEFVNRIEFSDGVKPKPELKEPKKEIEKRKDDPMLEFANSIDFSDEVKPKIEMKHESKEPTKEIKE